MVGSFGTLTATINRAYATHHGYGFFFGQIAKNTCVHPKLGVRHSAWCKILVIAHVLIEGIAGSSCSNILYIDTDAYVTNFTLSIDGFLERARERGDESIPDYKDGPWELYNLKKDRCESKNLASRYPNKVRELSAQWQKHEDEFRRQAGLAPEKSKKKSKKKAN